MNGNITRHVIHLYTIQPVSELQPPLHLNTMNTKYLPSKHADVRDMSR